MKNQYHVSDAPDKQQREQTEFVSVIKIKLFFFCIFIRESSSHIYIYISLCCFIIESVLCLYNKHFSFYKNIVFHSIFCCCFSLLFHSLGFCNKKLLIIHGTISGIFRECLSCLFFLSFNLHLGIFFGINNEATLTITYKNFHSNK